MAEAQNNLQQILQNMQGSLGSLNQQVLRARQAIGALQLESAIRREGREPKLPAEFTAQFGEDLLIWDLLGQQTTGFFIEAGAFDGYHYSVTYPLEAAGWTGLLVEAIPERYQQCVTRRPGSQVVNAALAGRGCTGVTDFWVVDDRYGGLFSYSKPSPDHLQRVGNTPTRKVSVPLAWLDDLLRDHTGEIDLLVLDIEGAELDALNGFDLLKHPPRIMLIEDNTTGKNPALRNFMKPYPYMPVGYLAVNDIYIRNDQAQVLERLKWMMFT